MYSSLLLLRRRDEVMKLFRKARETLPETLPQNRIEELFVAGTDDLGARKSFYELLLASDVFVEGTASEKSRDAAGGFHVVGVDPGLTVESFGPPGQQFIVFYTSLSRMDGQLATFGPKERAEVRPCERADALRWLPSRGLRHERESHGTCEAIPTRRGSAAPA